MRYAHHQTSQTSSPSVNARRSRLGLCLTLVAMGLFSGLVQGQNRMAVVVDRVQQQQLAVQQVDQDMRAGVAAALASTQLVQANQPGQQVMSLSGGQWQSQGGHSIGWSAVSASGDMVWQANMSGSGDRQQGVAAAVGYQF